MSNQSQSITIETLEALALQMETEDTAERARLARLIRAYSRILAVREPQVFKPAPCEFSDEEGYYDNSYPPQQDCKDHSGPRLLRILADSYEQVPTTVGFYYQWRAAATDPGLYITPTGELFGCATTGDGRFGQFAAHPGHCDVMLALEWSPLQETTVARLRQAEQTLRAMAFPLIARMES